MPFKVEVGPPQISIHQGQTVLITEDSGQINWPSDKGLYFFDTRIVSSWTIYANGEPWELLNGGPISYYASRIYLTNRSLRIEDGTIQPRTLGLTISRWISGGMHEDLDITNNSRKAVKFQLEIGLRCDFADIFEVKSGSIVRRGHITTDQPHQHLRTTYCNGDFSRAVTVSPARSSAKAVYANGRLSFEVALEPGASWHCCLLYSLTDGARHFASPTECAVHSHNSPSAETMADWLQKVAKIQTSNEVAVARWSFMSRAMATPSGPGTRSGPGSLFESTCTVMPASSIDFSRRSPMSGRSSSGFGPFAGAFLGRNPRRLIAPGSIRRTTAGTVKCSSSI